MTDISLRTRISRSADLLANEVSESETVMLDVAAGSYYGLRDVGKAIWDNLEVPLTVEALCDRLMAEFDVDTETCQRETIAFLGKLHERGLIVATN